MWVALLFYLALSIVFLIPFLRIDDQWLSALDVALRWHHFGCIRGLRLPPSVPVYELPVYQLRHGLFALHVATKHLHQKYGPVFSYIGKVFVSDPSMVREVLADKHLFPTRGPVGVETFAPKSLIALPTSEIWSVRR
jgi:hypothetical protein